MIVGGNVLRGGDQFRKHRAACQKIQDFEKRKECLSMYQWKTKPGSTSNSNNNRKPQQPPLPNQDILSPYAKILVGNKKYDCNMISEGGKKKTKRKSVKSKTRRKTRKTRK
jgi:hypothetical protein